MSHILFSIEKIGINTQYTNVFESVLYSINIMYNRCQLKCN